MAESTVSEASFRFVELPSELRGHVYTCVAAEDHKWEEQGFLYDPQDPAERSFSEYLASRPTFKLLCASQQIYKELRPQLSLDGRSCLRLPPRQTFRSLYWGLQTTLSNYLDHIQEVRVIFQPPAELSEGVNQVQARQYCDTLSKHFKFVRFSQKPGSSEWVFEVNELFKFRAAFPTGITVVLSSEAQFDFAVRHPRFQYDFMHRRVDKFEVCTSVSEDRVFDLLAGYDFQIVGVREGPVLNSYYLHPRKNYSPHLMVFKEPVWTSTEPVYVYSLDGVTDVLAETEV